jgi:hypothetical protein
MPKTNSKFPTLHQWGLGEVQNGFFTTKLGQNRHIMRRKKSEAAICGQ